MSNDTALSMAVQAFEELERVDLLLAKKKIALTAAVLRLEPEQMADYVRLTNDVLAKYEEKRERAHV